MAKGLPVMSNHGRKVVATQRTGGMLRKGNKGRTISAAYGNLRYSEAVKSYGKKSSYEIERGNPFATRMPSDKAMDLMAEKEMHGLSRVDTNQARWGRTCPSCHTVRSRTGECYC